MRIYLVGFMGCGKTSVGKRAANLLKYDLLDMDAYLEDKYKKTIPEIFKEDGEQRFREMEKDVLYDTFRLKKTVISAGGGTPCFFDNMDLINIHGVSFYIKHKIDFFVQKLLSSDTERPLVKGKSEDELREYIKKTLDYRKQFYEKAHHIIKVNNRSKDEVAEEIYKKIKKKK